MLMTLLATVFSSVAAGGATGLLGIGIQRFFDWLNAKTQIEKQRMQNAHELAVMTAEWQGRLSVAKEQGDAQRDVADSGALASSYQGAFERFATWDMKKDHWAIKAAFVLLDVVRGLVRPLLTAYLCILTTLIYNETVRLMTTWGLKLSAEQVMQILMLLIGTIVYLFTTCVCWWFGTRNRGNQPAFGKG